MHGVRGVWLAAAGDVPLLCQCGADLAQRHPLPVHLSRQRHHLGPQLDQGLAAAASSGKRLLAGARRRELVDNAKLPAIMRGDRTPGGMARMRGNSAAASNHEAVNDHACPADQFGGMA